MEKMVRLSSAKFGWN